MAHIILKEEEPKDPPITLAAPATTMASIDAAKDEKVKKEKEAQRNLEIQANQVVFAPKQSD